MIFLIPILLLIFILLLILRLVGGHVSWDEVFIPLIIYGVIFIMLMLIGMTGRRNRKKEENNDK